jgi:hypothetical protein
VSDEKTTMTDSRICSLVDVIRHRVDWLETEIDRIPPCLLPAPETSLLLICNDFVKNLRLSFNQDSPATQALSAELPIFIYKLRQTLPLFDVLITEPSVVEGSAAGALEANMSIANRDDCIPTIWRVVNKLVAALKEIWDMMGGPSTRTTGWDSSPGVDTRLMKLLVPRWERLCLDGFERVYGLIKRHVIDMITEEFKRFKTTGFQTLVRYFLSWSAHLTRYK